jgi:hypothetical protein
MKINKNIKKYKELVDFHIVIQTIHIIHKHLHHLNKLIN